MKKIITTIFLAVFLFTSGSNCLLFNMLGLNPGHEKGTVAAGRIQDVALETSLINYVMSIGMLTSMYGGLYTQSQIMALYPWNPILAMVSDVLAGIDPGAYYKTSEVDACVDSIKTLGILIGDITPATCNLQPDNAILDP